MTDAERIDREVARLDKEFASVRAELKELRDDYQASCLENNNMGSEIKWIREILTNMAQAADKAANKKISGFNIIVAVMLVLIGIGTLFGQIQNNQIQKEMVRIAQGSIHP